MYIYNNERYLAEEHMINEHLDFCYSFDPVFENLIMPNKQA